MQRRIWLAIFLGFVASLLQTDASSLDQAALAPLWRCGLWWVCVFCGLLDRRAEHWGGQECLVWQAVSGKGKRVGYPMCSQAGSGQAQAAAMVGETAVADKKRLGEDDMVGSSYRISRSWVHRRYYGVSGVSGEVVVDL